MATESCEEPEPPAGPRLARGARGRGAGRGARAATDGPLYLSARNDAAGRRYASGFDATGAPRFDLTLAGRGHAFAVRSAATGGGPLLAAPGPHGARHRPRARAGSWRRSRHARDRLLLRARSLHGRRRPPLRDRGGRGRGPRTRGLLRPRPGATGAWASSPTHGIGPHEMTVAPGWPHARGGQWRLRDPAPTLRASSSTVTGCGPSLVLLDARDGRLLDEGRLAEPLWRLSLRHLAVGRGDVIAVAAQDEGDLSDLLPLAAVWRRGAGLDAARRRIRPSRRGCAATAGTRRWTPPARSSGVSCPRGGLAVFWDLGTARVIGTVDLPDGCGLAAADAPGAFLLTSGRGGVVRVEPSSERVTPLPASFVAARAGTITSPSDRCGRRRASRAPRRAAPGDPCSPTQ